LLNGSLQSLEDAPSLYSQASPAATEHPHKLSEQIVKELSLSLAGETAHSTHCGHSVKNPRHRPDRARALATRRRRARIITQSTPLSTPARRLPRAISAKTRSRSSGRKRSRRRRGSSDPGAPELTAP
jgi:hypothetical protein